MNQKKAGRPPVRLVLKAPVIETTGLADWLAGACAAGDVAAVIVRLSSAGDVEISARARILMPPLQEQNIAFLLENRADLAVKIGADGAHLSDAQALRDARPIL